MGELIHGQWMKTGIDTVLAEGALKRPPSVFRDWITADGSDPGTGRIFEAEAGRYHLYVSRACP